MTSSDTRRDAPRVRGRNRVVWQLLSETLRGGPEAPRRPLVLDCGGGSGSFAVPLAEAGAEVTLVDVSVDALATLQRRAAEAGVADRVHAVQGDVEALAEVVPAATFDLALLHEVLDAVDDPALALRQVAAAVRPGGRVSVLVANPAAGVFARALAGDVRTALDELRALTTAEPPAGPAAVAQLCRGAGLAVERVHGVGVFAELVPGAELDGRPGGRAALDELEELAADRPPFRDIAGRLHVLARRVPAG